MHVTKAYPQAHDLMYFFHNENRLEFYVIYELSNHFSPAFQTRSTPPSSVYYGEPSEALQNRVRFGCTMPAKRNIRGTFMYTKLTATSVINIQRNTQHCRSNINNMQYQKSVYKAKPNTRSLYTCTNQTKHQLSIYNATRNIIGTI